METSKFIVNAHTCTELSPLDVDRPNALDETVRRVERGSRIVTAIPCDIRVVLQVLIVFTVIGLRS